ncbi:MAG: GNAT family N-acetyltransferase [Kangiellaceae bacterium]|nr:GNAT family N-acetyltransferase [Kangiellaceae bacterium]
MSLTIQKAQPEHYQSLGSLLVEVYSQLDDFPKPDEQPAYYQMLANIGDFSKKAGVSLLIALHNEKLVGGVVYFADMSQYGSGGLATKEKNTAGFRLLGVSPKARGLGVGKALSQACIDLAKEQGHTKLAIHTTQAMQTAWGMYQKLGFVRYPKLDFDQQGLAVFGFKLELDSNKAEIDLLIQSFFHFFDNRSAVDFEISSFKQLFIPQAIIVKNSKDLTEVFTLSEFLAPRIEILTNGTLVDFHEWPTSGTTEVFDTIAQHQCIYQKNGVLNGENYSGSGQKLFHLVKADGQWKISSVVWQDNE